MTARLEKAILLRLKQIPGSGKDAKTKVMPDERGAFAVQFNPTSLKITRQNNIDKGGSTTKTQRRTTPSSQSATLTFDLEFDTAEGDENGRPVDVRTRTHIIRQFAEPSKDKPKEPPPPIRFIWGTFTFTGVVTQLTEDLDYFAPTGMPLRAKVSVTITEQNQDFEAKLVGAAVRDLQSTTLPGEGGNNGSEPGSKPASKPSTAAQAHAGESLQQLLSRINADPATWRAAMAGLDSPIGLAAGAQVQLGAQVSAGAGFGVTAGFAAGAQASAAATLGAALGVNAGASIGAGATAGASIGTGASAGFALAAGGGVAASMDTVIAANVAASTATARASFAVPAFTASASGSASVGGPATVDARATTFASGVPLRPRADAFVVAEASIGNGSRRIGDGVGTTMRWPPGR